MKKLTILTVALLLTALVQLTAPPVQAEVSIPDANLAAALRETLGLPTDAVITADVMLDLTRLEAEGKGIAELTGLEHAVNLTRLELGGARVDGEWHTNPISDVSPLAALTQLTYLSLDDTAVSDVSPLANLTQLTYLDLLGTDVSDVSPLAALTQLTYLDLLGTDVSDISPLSALTQLTSLSLGRTAVSDVSPLANLTQLTGLFLGGTAVSDVSPLANLTQLTYLHFGGTGVSDVSLLANLTQLTYLSLRDTAVSDVSPLANLTQLTYLSLDDTAVSDVSPLANLTQLTELNLRSTAVSDVSPLANLTQLKRLFLGGTGVSDVSPLLGLNLTGTSWDSIGLRLKGSPLSYASLHTHIPAMQAKGIEVEFDNVAHPALLKTSGDGQEGAGATALPTPFVVEAMDEHGEPIVGKTVAFDILAGGGTLSAQTATTDAQGTARVTFTLGAAAGINKVKVTSEGIASWVLFTAVATEEVPQLVSDVNGDGVVTTVDLALVALRFGETGADIPADVNGDGLVDIDDLVLVAKAVDAAGAPALAQEDIETGGLQAADVRRWLRDAKAANADPVGIAALEQLLAALTRAEAPPRETVLLANYPNPFNPETWIPYELAEAAEVTVTLHASDGKRVRTLALGQVPAGIYQSRSRAAYWDGRNAQGEPVASGVYFYTLQAGDFSATRKMVIRK